MAKVKKQKKHFIKIKIETGISYVPCEESEADGYILDGVLYVDYAKHLEATKFRKVFNMENEIEKLKIEVENLKEQLRLSSELNKAYSLIISNQNKSYIPYTPYFPYTNPVYPNHQVYCGTSALGNTSTLTKGE